MSLEHIDGFYSKKRIGALLAQARSDGRGVGSVEQGVAFA